VCAKDCALHTQKYQYNNFIFMFSWLAWFFISRNLKILRHNLLKTAWAYVYTCCPRLGLREYQHAMHLWGPQSLAHCVVIDHSMVNWLKKVENHWMTLFDLGLILHSNVTFDVKNVSTLMTFTSCCCRCCCKGKL